MSNEHVINFGELLDFSGKSHVPVILQDEIAECGLACLAMVAHFHGHRIDMGAMRRRFPGFSSGMTVLSLVEASDQLSLAARPLQCDLNELSQLRLPCVLHWDLNHFVVLTRKNGNQVTVHDPNSGKRVVSLDTLSKHFTGVAVEFVPTQQFKPKKEKSPFYLWQLWNKLIGFKRALLQVFAISLLLQLLMLAGPYYIQLTVDEVIVSRDADLLVVLAVGFGFVGLFHAFTNSLRSWLILRMSSLISFQIGVNLFRHLLNLPLPFFERRHMGDIVSRFGSLNDVKDALSSGLIEAFIDGLMAITLIVVMLFYSVTLTLWVIGFIFIFAVLRVVLYPKFKRAEEDVIVNEAKEQSTFLEGLRGIQAIKLFQAESHRQGVWQNRFAEVINSDIRLGRLTIRIETLQIAIFGLENITIIFLAALAVLGNELSVGMLLAFLAYKQQLVERSGNLLDQVVELKMLRLHLDRIADIALHPVDATSESATANRELENPVHGHIILENIGFRYEESTPWLFRGVNAEISSGESVALSGASGTGKTTLLKIILGLLQPTEGRILIDGVNIHQGNIRPLRRSMSAVMQNDTLFSGSILDNVTFFASEANWLKAEQCCQRAAVHESIQAMPMHYHTLVGDMGSSLSGGQIQRILLARALYREPKILCLDEATSHLDTENEMIINDHLRDLKMTRIMIAHREHTLSIADRVLWLEADGLYEGEEDPVSDINH